ncbi:hypothetical protein [Pontibacter indicus]|uniref:hypothetical protein n=1 Tax=Pontibacter indicus TaxID=1317125 RepID=UPI0026A0E976
MARSSAQLVAAIRQTADRLAKGAIYQWGHMGSCNCGHLAQTITQLDKGHIHGATGANSCATTALRVDCL